MIFEGKIVYIGHFCESYKGVRFTVEPTERLNDSKLNTPSEA